MFGQSTFHAVTGHDTTILGVSAPVQRRLRVNVSYFIEVKYFAQKLLWQGKGLIKTWAKSMILPQMI